MTKPQYFEKIKDKKYFDRKELLDSFRSGGFTLGEASFCNKLAEMIKGGEIIRVGNGVYCLNTKGIKQYVHEYSDLAKEVASLLQKQFPLLTFSIMELVQYNEFINHQVAHNSLFVSVEADIMDFVFDTLRQYYFGKVFINPTSEVYHRYLSDDAIIINKLISESPKGFDVFWHVRLEKLLVDMVADSLVSESISDSEYPNVYEDAFSMYAVDESCMFRYASRRAASKKIENLISQKTNITLLRRRQENLCC